MASIRSDQTAFTVDPQASVVVISRSGAAIDPEHFDEVVRQLERDPRLGPGFDVVYDVGEDVLGAPSFEAMERVVRSLSQLHACLGPFRTAVVAAREVHYGLANAASILARDVEGMEIRGFRTRDAAISWLHEARRREPGVPG